MSTVTASDVSQRISTLDHAIREALQSGNIAEVMKQNKAELGWLFKTRRSLSNMPDAVAQAYSARVFLWPFCLAWTKAGLQADDHFIADQPTTITHGDRETASGLGIRPPHSTNPSIGPILPVPQRQPKASSSALPAQPVQAKASSSALPVQPTASSSALPLQQALQSEEEVTEEEENEEELKQTAERKLRSKPLRGDKEMDPPCLRCIGKGITCWRQVRPTKACYDCGRQKLGCTQQGVDPSAGSMQPKKSQASAKATAPPRQPTQKAKGKKAEGKVKAAAIITISHANNLGKRHPSASEKAKLEPRMSSDWMGYLEEIMDGIKGDVSGLLVGDVTLQSQVGDLELEVRRVPRFEKMVGQMEKRTASMEDRMERMEETIEERMDRMEERLVEILQTMEERMERMEERIEWMEGRTEEMAGAINTQQMPNIISASAPMTMDDVVEAPEPNLDMPTVISVFRPTEGTLPTAAPMCSASVPALASSLAVTSSASASALPEHGSTCAALALALTEDEPTDSTPALDSATHTPSVTQGSSSTPTCHPGLNLILPTPQTSQEEAQYATTSLVVSSSGPQNTPMPVPMPVTSAIPSAIPSRPSSPVSTHAITPPASSMDVMTPIGVMSPGPSLAHSGTPMPMDKTSATPSASLPPSRPSPGLLTIPTSARTSQEVSPVSPGGLRRSPRLMSPTPGQPSLGLNTKKRNTDADSGDEGHLPKHAHTPDLNVALMYYTYPHQFNYFLFRFRPTTPVDLASAATNLSAYPPKVNANAGVANKFTEPADFSAMIEGDDGRADGDPSVTEVGGTTNDVGVLADARAEGTSRSAEVPAPTANVTSCPDAVGILV
ncbi:hypothetical protein BYT27DRAFT_7207557 [Phlegmacium glaucopus]|nr:hypothetical protein BYT27DRAFT_7207557 [Phlegmacium glaucopus]